MVLRNTQKLIILSTSYFVSYTFNILFIAFYGIFIRIIQFSMSSNVAKYFTYFLVYMYSDIINVYMFSLPPPCHFMRQLLICQSIIRRKQYMALSQIESAMFYFVNIFITCLSHASYWGNIKQYLLDENVLYLR